MMFKKNFRHLDHIYQWGTYFSSRVTIGSNFQPRLYNTAKRVGLCDGLCMRTNSLSKLCNPILLSYRRDISKNPSCCYSSRLASNAHPTEANFERKIRDLQSDCTRLLSLDHIPPEKDVENLLIKCISVARRLTADAPNSIATKSEATTALLALDNSKPKRNIKNACPELQRMLYNISDIAHHIIKHPTIFISPKLLKQYVNVQATVGRADTLLEAFRLYSHKPIPLKDTFPIRYSKQKPDMFTNAIPTDVAEAALKLATMAKQLVIALDIIEVAYTSKAFKASKFVRKALIPISALAITPFAIYALASQLSYWQTSMDHDLATNVAFMGLMAYIGLTGTVGFIAISTSNDQMDRVTWAPGVPLRQRWMREDERAAIDQVSSAWGFQESHRRGEEEGDEWELIKEWVSRRAMILDRVELMEGMN